MTLQNRIIKISTRHKKEDRLMLHHFLLFQLVEDLHSHEDQHSHLIEEEQDLQEDLRDHQMVYLVLLVDEVCQEHRINRMVL